ncbi:MAG: helix-turn-helix domain-containing protein [Betaproteobacteria bacterium]|nr:helix-turn-helix domain-containing protein [Betaproteobacteria bacterium]
MLSQGKHPSVIGHQCGVSHQTIYNWRHAWEQEGSGWPDQRAYRRSTQKAERGMPCDRVRACPYASAELRGIVQRAEAIHG